MDNGVICPQDNQPISAVLLNIYVVKVPSWFYLCLMIGAALPNLCQTVSATGDQVFKHMTHGSHSPSNYQTQLQKFH